MPVRGAQDIWVVGASVLFQRDGETSDEFINLGTIKSIAPQFESEEVELTDSRGGVRTTVFKAQSSFTEAYELVCANFNPANLALIFNSKEPASWSQSATQLVDVPHNVGALGGIIKLKDASGNRLYNLTSIDGVKLDNAGSPGSAASAASWEVADLLAGTIRIKSGGTITADSRIYITMTPVAVAAGLRLIEPQSAGGTISGKAIIELGRDGNVNTSFRECDVSLSVSSVTLTEEGEGSEFTALLTVLKNNATTTFAAGRLVQVKGSLPSAS